MTDTTYETIKPIPILVGEANPYGGDPDYALYPSPEGCSGHRLCCLILGMRRADYLREFGRVNLCPHRWDAREARDHAEQLKCVNSRRILLGAKVCRAFGFKFAPLAVETYGVCGTKRALILPHPSGLCRLWNEAGMVERTREAVACFAPQLRDMLGAVDADRGATDPDPQFPSMSELCGGDDD